MVDTEGAIGHALLSERRDDGKNTKGREEVQKNLVFPNSERIGCEASRKRDGEEQTGPAPNVVWQQR
nr:hypothetical protein [Tanacetum cinerariifolium]